MGHLGAFLALAREEGSKPTYSLVWLWVLSAEAIHNLFWILCSFLFGVLFHVQGSLEDLDLSPEES